MSQKTIRSIAPLRLGLGGGSSDLSQFVARFGGEVLNATIDKYVHASLVPHDNGKITIHSEDYGTTLEYNAHEELPYNSELDLVCAVINRMRRDYVDRIPNCGFDIYLRSDAPPGAGLGTSSTVCVAILGLFKEWGKLDLDKYEIAKLAWSIEREDMKMAGGKQDQYAAVFGGFNMMYFKKNGDVLVVPLKIPRATLLELQNNLLVIYSGNTHKSGDIIKSQTPKSEEKFRWIMHIRDIAHAMVEDILAKDLENFGELMSMEWGYKKMLSDKVSTPELDNLADIAKENGAVGVKITGAGGGGMFLIYHDKFRRQDIIDEMSVLGCERIDYSFSFKGLQTWSVNNGR